MEEGDGGGKIQRQVNSLTLLCVNESKERERERERRRH